jgi:hypothetical protein
MNPALSAILKAIRGFIQPGEFCAEP